MVEPNVYQRIDCLEAHAKIGRLLSTGRQTRREREEKDAEPPVKRRRTVPA